MFRPEKMQQRRGAQASPEITKTAASQQQLNTRINTGALGIGFDFAANTLESLEKLNNIHASTQYSLSKVTSQANETRGELNSAFNLTTQHDINLAMASGLDLRSGSIAQVASQRSDVLARENARLNAAEALETKNLINKRINADHAAAKNALAAMGMSILGLVFL